MKLTFLGTGTSVGVPQIGCSCEVCRSSDPRDRRLRCGALVESESGSRVLIDAPPELRIQLIAAGVSRVDALLITHDHADHTHGLDDIRGLTVRPPGPMPVYGPTDALAELVRKFPYVFDQAMRPLPGTSKPEARAVPVTAELPFRVGDLEIEPVEVPHGAARVFGYRIGAVAYVTDAKVVPAAALARLKGVSVLVVNALRRAPHPTHLSIDDAIGVAAAVGAARTYLTHLTHDQSHAALLAQLPRGIEPAFDGLAVTVD